LVCVTSNVGLPWFGGLETPVMVSISKNQMGIRLDFEIGIVTRIELLIFFLKIEIELECSFQFLKNQNQGLTEG
jgi:hypothetical protein